MKQLQKNRGILAFLMIFTLLVSMIPSNTIVKAASYQDWKQYDSRWGSKTLGDNGTMSSWGCKITSLAILMVHAGVENESTFNPGVLRDRYENAGYITHSSSISADGNLCSGATSQSFSPKFYYVDSHYYPTESFATIRSDISSLLNSGYYVEVRVKNNGHSVAVNYCSSSEVYIMDPGYSGRTTLSYYDGGIYCINYYKAVKSTVADTLSASGYNYPTTLTPGQAFSIYGTVTSGSSNIKSLTAGVYTTGGTLKTGKTVYPNTRTYSLANVDPYVYFNNLTAGTYVYKVTATNSSTTATVINRTFTVKGDTITASGYNYPTSLKKGQAYSIYGTVTSSVSNIKSLTCGVYTTGGTLKTGKTVSPNAKSYSLANVDAYVYFNNLAAGTYDYKVIATNSAGTTTVINKRFTVS